MITQINPHEQAIYVYRGLSTDTKPVVGIPNASTFYEMDTGANYIFNADDSEWVQMPISSTVDVVLEDDGG